MTMFDEEAPRKRCIHEIGQDLSLLSVAELAERIAQLTEEIARLKGEMAAKDATRNKAEALFRRD